jgi:bifunctional non-homologous end joining protein LigD
MFPGFIAPSLATLADRASRGERWVHEIKYDGYRFQCHIQHMVRFFTRRGHEWTERLTHLVQALQPLTDRAMILDGEVIVEMPEGRSDFHALEKELKVKGGSQRLVFYAFDLLYFGGYDLRDVPLLDRKRLLREVLPTSGPVKFSEHIEGDGPSVWQRACELELGRDRKQAPGCAGCLRPKLQLGQDPMQTTRQLLRSGLGGKGGEEI